jgi:pimeloyl-ACP methyl ester carboxylesterase
MKLYVKKTGDGDKALIILHGLFGMGDNWAGLAKAYSEKGFTVYLPDLRNHGRSPHDSVHDYKSMAGDILELMESESLEKAFLIGHSMGGKTAMFFACMYPERVERMVVVDIAPRYYPPHHHAILAAIHSVDTRYLNSRKEAESKLKEALREESTIQFLLKNLYWNEIEKLDWRFNVRGLEENLDNTGEALPGSCMINLPVLFISGERSGYIQEKDKREIRKQFSRVSFETVPDAGHWVHAENPAYFLNVTLNFLE